MAKTKEMTREQVSAYIVENWVHYDGKTLQGDDLKGIVDRTMISGCRKIRSEIAGRLEWCEGLYRKSWLNW